MLWTKNVVSDAVHLVTLSWDQRLPHKSFHYWMTRHKMVTIMDCSQWPTLNEGKIRWLRLSNGINFQESPFMIGLTIWMFLLPKWCTQMYSFWCGGNGMMQHCIFPNSEEQIGWWILVNNNECAQGVQNQPTKQYLSHSYSTCKKRKKIHYDWLEKLTDGVSFELLAAVA